MKELYYPFKALCEQRKSVRQFADQAVATADLEKIKQIAATAPYAAGRKNWEIVVVEDKTVIRDMVYLVNQRSDELRNQLKDNFRDEFEVYATHFTSFATAPVLFIPTFRIPVGLSYLLTNAEERIVQWERDSYVKSISGVALLILLAAESLGLGGCYMTGPLLAEEDIKQLLSIRPDRNLGAIIPVGYSRQGE